MREVFDSRSFRFDPRLMTRLGIDQNERFAADRCQYPVAALHRVSNHDERLYSDVQLAARRSLASMALEQILTNRNQLSEDILREVKGSAGTYGVTILRADVKDLVFPGNLQEIMNKVLAAERLSEAQLVETRTKAEQQRIEAEAKAKIKLIEASNAAEAEVTPITGTAPAGPSIRATSLRWLCPCRTSSQPTRRIIAWKAAASVRRLKRDSVVSGG